MSHFILLSLVNTVEMPMVEETNFYYTYDTFKKNFPSDS